MRDLFNSIGNTLNDGLYKLDQSIHNNIKNTFIDDFIHELQDKLWRFDLETKLNRLDKDTIFYINDVYTEYIDCIKVGTYDHFHIPRDMFPENIRNTITDQTYFVKLSGEDNYYHLFGNIHEVK